jgi:regulatory protein YycI of two-component signal transduction system YycFG
MDWKKAKTILILGFFILNIVLAIVLYNSLKVAEISQQTINNTSRILEQNNVHIEWPVPKYTGNDYTLKYEEKPLDKDNIVAILLGDNSTTVDNKSYKNGSMSLFFNSDSGFEFYDTDYNKMLNSDSKTDVDKYLKKLSGELGIPFDEFKQDDYYPDKTYNGTRVIYKGQYEGYSVFDNYIDVEASKTAIKSIKYHYKKPISITVKDGIYVIPAYEILITKMTNYPGTTIKDIDMGFKGYTEVDKETKTLYEGLSWRIKTYNGKEYYFNARNGVEME